MTRGAWALGHRCKLRLLFWKRIKKEGTYVAGVDLIALCVEARRRRMTYGQLIARTSEAEQKEIIAKYREVGKKKENKGTQKRAGW